MNIVMTSIKNFGILEEELIQKYSKDILKGLEYLKNENVNLLI